MGRGLEGSGKVGVGAVANDSVPIRHDRHDTDSPVPTLSSGANGS